MSQPFHGTSITEQPSFLISPRTPLKINLTFFSCQKATLAPMDSGKSTGETAILMPESKSSKGKATIIATTKAVPLQQQGGGGRGGRGFAIFDFILRLCALITTVAAAATMATTDQSLPFFNQLSQFEASYDDLPSFSYFVVANAISSGYLVLSMPFSIICIVRPHVAGARILLLILDTVMVGFTTAAAAAAASIVYLAHTGNSTTNWFAICPQYTNFCERASGAVVASFIAAVILIFLVILSGISLTRQHHHP